MGSGCCFVAGFLVPPNPFCGAGGVGGALPVLGPVQPAPVTNTSWFSACLPGAGASLGIADSPQHLPLVPPQLPDEYFPFSHSFNCPTWRKLLRTGSGLLRTAGHPRSGGVGDGMWGAAHHSSMHGSTRCLQPCRDLPARGGTCKESSFLAAPLAAPIHGSRRAAGGSARTLAPAWLNAARQVYGEARPVRLDFWEGWSQPRHQPLPVSAAGPGARSQPRAVAPLGEGMLAPWLCPACWGSTLGHPGKGHRPRRVP